MALDISSKELVHRVFKGEETLRIPLYFLLADPKAESKVNDVIGITCWFKAFNTLLEQGGPFRRGEKHLMNGLKNWMLTHTLGHPLTRYEKR
ncbi:MAG: hypothetical protein AOA65_0682 [Candidatus Bathyarchaeota archaeon BA1]|nr:MAG: hypothetical protein AOA65_0682 [Candidatus Bathyarchaeota archaeon BA1]